MTVAAAARFGLIAWDEVGHHLSSAYDAAVNPASGNRSDFVDASYATWLIRSGSVAVRWHGGSLAAGPGDWVFGDPIQPRSQHFSPGAVILSVRFSIRQPPGHELFAIEGLPRLVPATVAAAAGLEAAGRALVATVIGTDRPHGQPDPAVRLDASTWCQRQASFHDWLSCWYQVLARVGAGPVALDPVDGRLQRALAVLRRHRGVGPLPWAALQAASGLSRAQLDRICVSELGCTPHRWCVRRCLAEADRQLRTSPASIRDIARQLGFSDASHFGSWFHRQTNIRPLDYRRQRPGA